MSNLVKWATWIVFVVFLGLSVYTVVRFEQWEVYDSILVMTAILALALGITFSQSYGLPVKKNEKDDLKKLAIKLDATNLHAHFSWRIIGAWMTITPLYCTTVVIFIGSQYENSGQISRIIIYSMLSLITSLSMYAIKPEQRSKRFMQNHNILRKELLVYIVKDDPDDHDKSRLVKAISESEEMKDYI